MPSIFCVIISAQSTHTRDNYVYKGRMQMNAVIIEDEKEILNGMKDVVEQLQDRLDQVYTFDNAEEALQYILQYRPEIVITDIVLPRMSGLELLEQMLVKDYHPKIIMVSGYNNFEYAQKGIKLGVHDYILKPFNNAQFRNVVLGMIDVIDKEREEQLRHDPDVSALGTKTLRDKFLHGLCLKPTALQEHVYYRLKFWSLDWLAAADYHVVAIDFAKLLGQRLSEKDAELKSFAVGNIVEELIEAYPPSVLFKNTLNQWCLIAGRDDIEALTDEIADKVAAFQKYPVCMGISERTNAFQSLSTAYEQAVKSLHMCVLNNSACKQYYSELTTHKQDKESLVQHITASIMSMELTDIEPLIDALLKEFALAGQPNSIGELSKKCLEWIVELHTALAAKLESSLHHIPMELWDALDRCKGFEELKMCIVDYVSQLAHKITSNHSHYMIEKVKRMVEANYADNVTLLGIAETLSIHPVWLSQLFKRECGINFVDYLAEIRIEEAKKLLRKSELKIYEVVRAVGYADLQHFGQIFKKKTGMSPKEFRLGK
jgi:two-component system response regulator YesN